MNGRLARLVRFVAGHHRIDPVEDATRSGRRGAARAASPGVRASPGRRGRRHLMAPRGPRRRERRGEDRRRGPREERSAVRRFSCVVTSLPAGCIAAAVAAPDIGVAAGPTAPGAAPAIRGRLQIDLVDRDAPLLGVGEAREIDRPVGIQRVERLEDGDERDLPGAIARDRRLERELVRRKDPSR